MILSQPVRVWRIILRMKTYLMATSVLFGLLVVVHVWRAIVEPHLATDPFYIVMTLVSAGLCGWSWRLLRRTERG